MAGPPDYNQGIFRLPNEVLLHTLDLLTTRELVSLISTCRAVYALILRLVRHRLEIAASLDGHTLYLECHHPSEQARLSQLYCLPLGTKGLAKATPENEADSNGDGIGEIGRFGTLYTRFRPQNGDPVFRYRYLVPGDIQGSRTHPSGDAGAAFGDAANVVTRMVTVEASDLFSQLSTFAYLGRQERRSGYLNSIKEVCEGTIRVWRPWLSKHCETKSWTDGTRIFVEGAGSSGTAPKLECPSDDQSGVTDPKTDPSFLWINTVKPNVGIKFRVRHKRWRPLDPTLYLSEEEITVTYEVEFEEVVVRTTQLLLKLEDAQEQMNSQSFGKAIIFGTLYV